MGKWKSICFGRYFSSLRTFFLTFRAQTAQSRQFFFISPSVVLLFVYCSSIVRLGHPLQTSVLRKEISSNSVFSTVQYITYDSVYARSSHVFLYNCGLYNALQGLECYLAQGNVKDCCGSCSWAMVSYASLIIASGTVPAGSRGTGENGLLYANGVTTDYLQEGAHYHAGGCCPHR